MIYSIVCLQWQHWICYTEEIVLPSIFMSIVYYEFIFKYTN